VRVLLDSNVLLWYLLDDDRLSSAVKDLLEDTHVAVTVSVATQWELLLKAQRGRLRLPMEPERFFVEPIEEAGFRVLPVETRHVLGLAELPQIHADPFDRLLIAQALVDDLDLVTADEVVRSYPIRTLW
jgi:PIN domain nuclease of toxin-antitoxin system